MIRSGELLEPFRDVNPDQGIHEGVSYPEYHAWGAMRQTLLKLFLQSAAHFKHAIDHPAEDEDKKHFELGHVTHLGKLQPLEALRSMVVMPDFAQQVLEENGDVIKPRATKRYRELVAEFEKANAGKRIVTQEVFEQVCGICDALNKHPLARRWLAQDGPVETSLVWRDPLTHELCKSRPDKIAIDDCLLIDLKTCRDVSRME